MFVYFFAILNTLFFPVEPVAKNSKAEIRFSNFAGTKPVSPDSTYTNIFKETYTVGRLKYYVTNIEFINAENGRNIKIADSYFLIDNNEDLSKTFSLTIPEGNYNAISFLLGVDSLHNVSGAQTGALDPINGMYWTWNTGYVSLKLEGRSPASTLPGNLIEYHLGGFKGPDMVNHRISLSFPDGIMKITENTTAIVNIKTDVNLFFSSIHSLPVKTNAACTSPGNLARLYSENYATIFSISKVDYK
jgi:hypothetical protein